MSADYLKLLFPCVLCIFAVNSMHKIVPHWQQQLTSELPDDLKSSLPTIEEIERELSDTDFATPVAKLLRK